MIREIGMGVIGAIMIAYILKVPTPDVTMIQAVIMAIGGIATARVIEKVVAIRNGTKKKENFTP